MITVREAKGTDADGLAELNRTFNGVARPPSRVRESLLAERSSETVLVAATAGALVGFLCYQTLHSMCYDAPWVEIVELYVVPAHRSRGAGGALLREAQVRAEHAGASEILLRTSTANRSAHRLLEQVGLNPAPHVVFRRSYAAAV